MIKKLWIHLVTMWEYFFTSLKLDQEDRERAASEGVKLPVFFGNLQNWFKIFGLTLFVIIIIIFSLQGAVKPRKQKKYYSHHGVNRYGERY